MKKPNPADPFYGTKTLEFHAAAYEAKSPDEPSRNMTSDIQACDICGEPMPKGEEMFKYHGYSGPCPKPPKLPEKEKAMTLRDEIRDAINRNSAENASDTPDFVLAQFLEGCLAAFDQAVRQREGFYGRKIKD